jgi:dienelactone hydrolase
MKHTFLLGVFCLFGLELAQAGLVTRSVAYEHGGVKLEGYMTFDDAQVSPAKPAPGVLVVHEWWGLNDYVKRRAESLAQLGYVAFALDMYGAGVRADTAQKAAELAAPFYGKPLMAERAKAGLDKLVASELVADGKVAAIGYCFGGATVQALAYTGVPLSGVGSFHGSPVVPTVAQAAGLKTKILICHGAIDPFIKAEEMQALLGGYDRGGVDYVFVSYAGAIHAFTNPDASRLAEAMGLSGVGYNEVADRRSWQHLQAFLRECFGQ